MARSSTSGQGRPKGVPNKATVDVQAKLNALGCDPIEGMARIALGDVPCPDCKATGKARYTEAGALSVDQAIKPETCRTCLGSKKEPTDTKLRADMFKELAQYVAPKRKAIEHSGDALGIEALLERLDAGK